MNDIVRCKECGYYNSRHQYCNRPYGHCVSRFPDDFCSRGVRSDVDVSCEVINETLRQEIKSKAAKSGCTGEEYFVKYKGSLYYINSKKDRIVLQAQVK